jgi:hypothetical protein
VDTLFEIGDSSRARTIPQPQLSCLRWQIFVVASPLVHRGALPLIIGFIERNVVITSDNQFQVCVDIFQHVDCLLIFVQMANHG